MNNKKNDNTALLVLGIVFMFIPFLSFLGIIFLIIYFMSFKGISVEDETQVKRDIQDIQTKIDNIKKDIEYAIEDEEVTNEEKQMYEEFEQYNQKIENETVFNNQAGAINEKGLKGNNDGPIKYY